MKRCLTLVVTMFGLLLVGRDAFGNEGSPGLHVVACSSGTCVTSFELGRDKADFAWMWSDESSPMRFSSDELTTLVRWPTRQETERVAIRVPGLRATAAARRTLIVAPSQMWVEVPEQMLPHFDVPKAGVVSVLLAGASRARVIGGDEGTWWSELDGRATELLPVTAVSSRFRVVEDGRKPLPGATVSIMAALGPGRRGVVAQYRSDRNGVVAIDAVPDKEPLTLVVNEAKHAPYAFTARISEIPSEIHLRPGYSISGRFIDSQKRPVAGVAVRVEGWLGRTAAVSVRQAVSGDDGAWTATAVPGNSKVVLAAAHRGFAPLRMDLATSDKPINVGTLVLERGQTVAFRVVDDATGKPVPNVFLSAGLGRNASTDTRGLAMLPDLSSASSAQITGKRDGYLSTKKTFTPPYAKENRIDLTRAFVVTGRFIQPSGDVIHDGSVRISGGSSFRDEGVSGSFTLSLEPDERIDLEFRSPATLPLRRTVSGKRGETLDLGLVTPPTGNTARGRVITEEGLPVAGATVWTPRPDPGGAVLSWVTGNVLQTQSDTSGAFELHGLEARPVLVRIDAAGFARAFLSVTADPATGVAEAGEIRIVKGTTVKVLSRREDGDLVLIAMNADTADVDTLTASTNDGVAVIQHVPPGRVHLNVKRDHSMICERDVEIPNQSSPFEVDCSTDLVHVHGTVLIGEKRATGGTLSWSVSNTPSVAGVIMNRSSELGATQQEPFAASYDVRTAVGDDGEFQSASLHPGVWRVRWFAPDRGSTAPRTVEISDHPENNVVLQYPDASIRGSVTDAKSNPVSHATVQEIGGEGAAVTTADGTFAMAGLLPGTHRLRATQGELVSDAVEISTETGREAGPVRLVLKPRETDTLSVSVLNLDGAPATNAFVFVERSDGSANIAVTDGDGRASILLGNEQALQVRCAVAANRGWSFGNWAAPEVWRKGLTFQILETGSLTVTTASATSAQLAIETSDHWNVTSLLLRIGSRPAVASGMPFTLNGLPPGTFRVTLGNIGHDASVEAGKVTQVHFAD